MSTHRATLGLTRYASTAGSCFAYVFALIGAVLVIGGCSDVPTAPGLGSDGLGGGSSIEILKTVRPGPEWIVQQLVDRHRTVMLLDGEDVKLTFQSKAVTQTTMIVARMSFNDVRERATRLNFDLQPSMSFSRRVELSVSSNYLAGKGGAYKLWCINPATGSLHKADEKPITPGQDVVFTLDHFSAYAVSR